MDSLATPTLTVFTQPGSFAAGRADALAAEAQAAIRHALDLLGEPQYPHRLRIFFVASRDEMEALVGQRSTGLAIAEERTVFLVASEDWRPLTRHEVMHVVSIGLWGHPLAPTTQEAFLAGGWLREGLATAAEGRCADVALDSVVAAMAREGTLIPLDTLTAAFYQQNDLDAYLQAGSRLGFIHQRYGAAAIRYLWGGDPTAFQATTERTSDEIDAAWREELAGEPAVGSAALAALRERGCG